MKRDKRHGIDIRLALFPDDSIQAIEVSIVDLLSTDDCVSFADGKKTIDRLISAFPDIDVFREKGLKLYLSFKGVNRLTGAFLDGIHHATIDNPTIGEILIGSSETSPEGIKCIGYFLYEKWLREKKKE